MKNTNEKKSKKYKYFMTALVAPLRRCVPTTTVRGPCHVCVCTAEGLFHCRAEMCRNEELMKQIPDEKECDPDMMYREISIFCRCSDIGFWLSAECRDVFKIMRPKDFTMRTKAATNLDCIPNTLYLLDCNICLCHDKGFIDFSSCTNRRCAPGHKADKCGTGDYLRLDNELCTCSDIHFYVDRLCLKVDNRKVQIVNRSRIANIIDIGVEWEELSAVEKRIQSSSCTSDSQYVLDCNKCVCYEGSMTCTNKSCAVDKSLRSGDFPQSLPMLESEHDKCNPGQKYRYKCNTCTCSANGEASCTTMICLEDFVMDMTELHKTWADLLTLPGIPDEGCKAGQVFKNDCNTCECTKDGILKCTKVACGSPLSESKLLARSKLGALDIPKEDCIPGILYKKGCQKCFCDHNLKLSCLTDKDRCQIEDEAWADLLTLPDIPADGTCTAGQIYKNDCNTCECSMDGILKCSMVACRAPSDELTSGVARSGSELGADLPKRDCIPGKMYKKGCQRCFCDYYHKLSCYMDKDGCNIKNEAKQNTLLRVHPAFKNDNITGLPKMPQQAYKCEPGMMYRVDCNKCLCFSDHNLHCSKMLCLSHDDKHRNLAKKLSGISCKTISKIKNPCIKCRCKNNATVCDEITGCVSGDENKILQLKGAQLDPKKLSIDAGEDKCIPKSVYRDDCNSCYCQAEKILRCTQKTCLKYTHVVALEKQRLYLEKHGL